METAVNIVPLNEERKKLESKLVTLRDEAVQAGGEFREETGRHEKAVFQWYQTEARAKLLPAFPSEWKGISDQKMASDERRQKLERILVSLMRGEQKVVQSQKEFLDRKLAELEKRLTGLKNPSDPLRNRLGEAIKKTADRRDSLIREISFLEQALKK